jgi:prepilin-type processing-associated H-X9-DG protein
MCLPTPLPSAHSQSAVYSFLLQSAGGKEKIGFDPADVEQAMCIIGLKDEANPSGSPHFGIVVRYVKPFDQASLTAKIAPKGTDDSLLGCKVRFNDSYFQMSCAFPNETTLLIATRTNLQWLLAAGSEENSLRKLAATADDSSVWQLLVAVAPIRPSIAPRLAEASQQLPPQFASLTKLPELTDTFTATLREAPHGAMQFDAAAVTANDAAANELAADVKQLLAAGHDLLLTQMGNAPSQVAAQFGPMSDKVVAALQPTQAGNQVKFHADIQSGPAAIGIMVALILPAVQAAREAADRNSDANNLKQLAFALLNFEDQHRRFPAQAIYDKQGKPLLSWRVAILPYLEEEELYKQFHLDEPWDSEHNKPLIEKMPDAFKHPKFNEAGKTVYQAVFGKGCAFEGTEGTQLASFTDGTSQTALVVESTPENAVPWTKPEDWTPDDQDPRKNLGGLFAGDISNIVFADGHVEGVAVTQIDPAILKAFFTRNGGERIPH